MKNWTIVALVLAPLLAGCYVGPRRGYYAHPRRVYVEPRPVVVVPAPPPPVRVYP